MGVLFFAAAIWLHLGASRTEAISRAVGPPTKGSKRHVGMRIQVVAALATIFMAGVALSRNIDLSSSPGNAVIVCIDSSASVEEVRRSYLPDLGEVIHEAAVRRATFYASDCGFNATGEVTWPIRENFDFPYSGESSTQAAVHFKVERLVRQNWNGRLTVRSGGGTPLGEVLAVMARQCNQAGGNCTLYLFTDGEWMDRTLAVRDGVSEEERRSYLETYLPQLRDLAGSEVNFIGVGYGTSMGEVHLGEAREIAAELIEAAGGKMGAWTTRL